MKKYVSISLALVMLVTLLPGVYLSVPVSQASGQGIISDPDFYAHVLAQIGQADGYVITADDVKDIEFLNLTGKSIGSLAGIEHFAALVSLTCPGSNLTELDLSGNPELMYLYVQQNLLQSLNITKNLKLRTLFCNDNKLTSLDVSKNLELQLVLCQYNQLTTLDISKNIALAGLACYGNNMGSDPDISVPAWQNYFTEASRSDDPYADFQYFSSTPPISGECGPNLTWELDEDTGMLTIRGTGNMYNFSTIYSYSTVPWEQYRTRMLIKAVTIQNGVTSIGDNAFRIHRSLRSIVIPDSVTSIGIGAFHGCAELTNLVIPDSVTSIGDYAFTQYYNPIYVSKGSYPHTYALNNFVPFVLIGCPENCCIAKVTEDIIVESDSEPKINLSKETIDLGSFVPAELDTGDGRWKPIKDLLSDEKFPKLLKKDLMLKLKDTGGTVVEFPQINKRSPLPKLVINYAIAADLTGATAGEWVLATKNSEIVKEGIQFGVAGSDTRGRIYKGKSVDENGWSSFLPGETNGVCVEQIDLAYGKVSKRVYFYRVEPKKGNNGSYTAGSVQKKFKVLSLQKPPKYKLKGLQIKVKANTYVNGTLYTEKTLLSVSAGDIIWQAATAKKPASARQIPYRMLNYADFVR
ncbi:MAG: leucine-rich repeat protein [Oscillospiraceae bacterium]|nr:leucine-rich repeat protein [Oscillospiraceae bacterium]